MMKQQLTNILAIFLLGTATLFGQEPNNLNSPSKSPNRQEWEQTRQEWEQTRQEMIDYGIDYLRFIQNEEGSFSLSPRGNVGLNAVVLLGLLESGLSIEDPMLEKGIQFLLNNVQNDGGIYSAGGQIASYESCLSLSCLNLAKKRGRNDLDEILNRAEKFVRAQQYNESTETSSDDVYYGGIGYGNETRPDLSNTQFFIETLNELGAGPDDPAIQDALIFVSRCQNLETENNPTEFASKNPDGGFFYTCAGEGESPAGEINGGLRSYGSMTYAGLKSLIYAGLDENDPRVKAATEWIRKNYSVNENPGLGRRGLFYYYHTMSKALSVLNDDIFIDKDQNKHFWKGELIDILKEAQNEDGSWVNDNFAWMENDASLVTGYVLIVLSLCKISESSFQQ
ncbi:MAG: terpene cyclase/mutase family protein [Planctomycetia bacterium]|nr:terpene cyclase/mutase family protein [Planctomycetia bacterium]